MSRAGIQEVRAHLRTIAHDVNGYTSGEAITTIDMLCRALNLALDTIDRIDMVPTQRSYTPAMQPVNGISHSQVDQQITTFARRIYLRPVKRST
jgi:hypothetical protein